MKNRFGYCRISDKDQNEGRQVQAMIEIGIHENDIYIDKQSGKDFDRPKYQELKKVLGVWGVLYIKSIDRLGRNYKQIRQEWGDITQNIKADINVIDMPLLDTTLHKDLLDIY
jgi:DNA invertase Pin-like site-specific DNA recombinase